MGQFLVLDIPSKAQAIGVPASEVILDGNGKFTARGTHDGILMKIFAAALPGNPATPLHPWDSTVPAFEEGTFDNGAGTWNVPDVPGARGNCLEDKFVVWYFPDGGPPGLDDTSFKGDSIGSGCGSGSGGSGSGGSGSIADGGSERERVVQDAVPRVYKLVVDVQSMNLGAFGAAYFAEGLLCSSNLYLTFDERISTPSEMVWSSTNMGDATGLWTLRISTACGQVATLDFRQLDRRSVSSPLLWSQRSWRFASSNRMTSDRRVQNTLAFPDVVVEPA